MNHIRYRDVLMKEKFRNDYETYYTTYSQHKRKKMKVDYYHIDEEFHYYNQLLLEEKKKVNALRNSLLYEEVIDDDEKDNYEQVRKNFIDLQEKVNYFGDLKDSFYQDTFKRINDKEKQIKLEKDELRGLYLSFKNKEINTKEWRDDVKQYFEKKQIVDTLYKKIKKLKNMVEKPKYYVKELTVEYKPVKQKTVNSPDEFVIRRKKRKKKKKKRKENQKKKMKSKTRI